jgi:SAM-dependent methyltransferase
MTPDWDAASAASFYDAYGEREWTRFEDGRFSPHGLDVYIEHLRRFVRAGDRVLDIGAGPGRFTIELARIGADVTVADLSPGQLELNRQHVTAAGAEARVVERVIADITDLSRWKDASFDATVCYGGPLSYVLDRADQSVAELVRVTKPRGHVLITAMSLIGTFQRALPEILDLVRRDGETIISEVVRTGVLPAKPDYGHSSKQTPIILPAKLYRWRELEALLSRHGTVVAAAAAGLLRPKQPVEPELQGLLSRIEFALAVEPGALSCGEHLLAVLRRER